MIIDEGNFQENVVESDVPVVLDFWAPWCGPCNAMTPRIEALAKELEGKFVVAKVNVDENPELSKKYKISSIPSFLFFKSGEEVERLSGVQTGEKIKEVLESLE